MHGPLSLVRIELVTRLSPNDTRLELVTSFKYLGIHFFENGNLARSQKRITEHASYALHNLFSFQTNRITSFREV